jgi:hypothetical protein
MVRPMKEILRRVVITVWTDGGQGTARRNAWISMVANTQISRARDEAEAAIEAALLGARGADRQVESAPTHAHA